MSIDRDCRQQIYCWKKISSVDVLVVANEHFRNRKEIEVKLNMKMLQMDSF